MTRSWDDLRQELEHVVFIKGATNTAHMIPASRRQVYNLINGKTQRPSLAMKACVEAMVERQRSCKVAQSARTED